MSYPVINLKKTGNNIYKFCKKKGLTADDLRKAMDFSCVQSVYRWFHGKTLPSLDNFYALSVLLGTSIESFLASDATDYLAPIPDEHIHRYGERLRTYQEECLAQRFTAS